MENGKFTDVSNQQLRRAYVDPETNQLVQVDIYPNTIAENVMFEDGELLQEKLDNGTLGGADASNIIAQIVGGASDAYNTLKELEDAILAHENEYDGLLSMVGGKADKIYVDAELDNIDLELSKTPIMAEGNIPLTLWHGTQVEYDAISTKDPNTIYFVSEE